MCYNDNMESNHTPNTSPGTKFRVEVIRKAGWHCTLVTCDRKRALRAEGTYIALGYLTRIREKPLKGAKV